MLNSINNRPAAPSDRDQRVAELKKAQNMFFKLLTTQLQCQDIENTVDMNQMTQQIFQMNELQTLISIDHKLDNMNDVIQSSSAASTTANMVGKYALTQTDSIAVNSKNSVMPVNYIINGSGPADATMQVIDSKGNTIHEAKLENISPNTVENFELNFRNPDGTLAVEEGIYKVHISAYDKKDRKPVSSQIYTTNKIQQALPNGEFILNNNKRIKLEEVLAIQDSPAILTYNPTETQKGKMTIQELMGMKSTVAA